MDLVLSILPFSISIKAILSISFIVEIFSKINNLMVCLFLNQKALVLIAFKYKF